MNAHERRLHARGRARRLSNPDAPVYERDPRARAQRAATSSSRCARPRTWRRSRCGRAMWRKPSTMFDAVLPLIERDRNPDLYATLISNLGYGLISLGEFDRALLLHTEALELFSARGDDSQTARELVGAGVHPVPQRQRRARADHHRKRVAALRTRARSGRARVGAAPRGQCRGRARAARHGARIPAPRRAAGQERRHHRAHARAHRRRAAHARRPARRRASCWRRCCSRRTNRRAPMRWPSARGCAQQQGRSAEALADLREADAIYARLKLDFNRIDTSSALALALLAAGDVQGAAARGRHRRRASKRASA